MRVHRAGGPTTRRHVLDVQQQHCADHNQHGHIHVPLPLARSAPRDCGVREEQTKHSEEHGEDRGRWFCQDADRGRENVEIISADPREGEVHGKRPDHAERGDHLRRNDDVVDGVSVCGVKRVPSGGGECNPAVR